MSPRVRPSALVLFPALVLSCADWPRFAADSESIGVFEQFHPVEVLEDGDWPDNPADMAALPPVELAVAMDSVRFNGSLAPYGTWVFEANERPFPDCPGITSGVEGHYEGDVDVFRIHHPGNALCLHLESPESNASAPWDVVAYAWNDSCAFGPFLTLATGQPDVPGTTGPGNTSSARDIGIRDVVVYVASGLPGPDTPDTGSPDTGSPDSEPTGYTLDVVATSDAGTCGTLTRQHFGEPR